MVGGTERMKEQKNTVYIRTRKETACDSEITLWKSLCFIYNKFRIADEVPYCVDERGVSGKQHTD